jgi:hypothetical protein
MVGAALYDDGDWKELQELYLHPWRARWRGRLWKAIRPWTWL